MLNVLLSPSKSHTIIDFGSNDTILGADMLSGGGDGVADGNVEFSEGVELLAGEKGEEMFCDVTSNVSMMTHEICAFFHFPFFFPLTPSSSSSSLSSQDIINTNVFIAYAKSICFNSIMLFIFSTM